MKIILSIGSIIGSLSLVTLSAYACSNKSGHTGMDPYSFLLLFIPLFVIGLVGLRYQQARKYALTAVGIAVSGIVLLLVLDRTNTLVEYEAWIDRGMPEKGKDISNKHLTR